MVSVSDCPRPEELAGLVGGLLSGDALERVAAHVDACPVCLSAAQEFRPTDVVLTTLRRGAAPIAPPADPGGRYSPVRLHAAGGLGEVHVAEDTELGRKVALKQIRPARADDPDSRRRFLREAEITARLEHPGVVPVHGLVWDAQGRPRYAMRLVEGESLLAAVRAFHSAEGQSGDPGERALALRGLLGRFVAVCQTVAYAHSRGVVHRDIKPSNIMLGPYGETLVVDWGLAKAGVSGQTSEVSEDPDRGVAATRSGARDLAAADDPDQTRPGTKVGTPGYMSPEQAAGRHDEVGPASDIYLLGGTLYTILTGRPPCDTNSPTPEHIVAPRRVAAWVPAALEAVCLKAMAPRPADRYASAAEVGAEVERWLAGEPVAAHPERWPARAARWARRHRVTVGGLVAGLLVAAVLGSGGAVWLTREAADRRAERSRLEAKDRDAVAQALAALPELVRAWRFREAEGLLHQTSVGLSDYATADDRTRLADALTDVRLGGQLDDIRLDKVATIGGWVDARVAAPAYRSVFEHHGLDCAGGDVGALGARVAASPLREVLLSALDDWAGKERDPALRDRLTRIARAADPDPWRDRFRDALGRNETADLRTLANEADATRLGPSAVVALAMSLGTNSPEAESLLRRSVVLHPADFWFNYWFATSGRQTGRLAVSDAVGHFRACVAARPQASFAHNNLGAALYELGDHAAAEAVFRRAIELDPKHAVAHSNLGYLLHRRRDTAGAEALLRRAIELDPRFAMGHTNLGAVLSDLGDLTGAEAAARRAVELAPDLAAARSHLGDVLLQRGNFGTAEAEYRRAIELNPKSATAHFGLGRVLSHRRDFGEAEAAFRKAIELYPDHALAHTNLGNCLRERGDVAGAKAAYRRAIEVDPKHASAHSNLGTLLREEGDATGAEAAYRRAIELDPNFAMAHNNLGTLLRAKGDVPGAEAALRRAIQVDPKFPGAHFNLGNLFRSRGDLDGAETEYRRAVEIDPKFLIGHYNLGNLLHERGDLTGALAALRRAVEVDPKSAIAHSTLGNALRESGDRTGAEAAIRRAIQLDPKSGYAHGNLALLLIDLGRFEEARASAERARDLFPPGSPMRLSANADIRRCEQYVDADRRLPAVLRGEERPANPEERRTLAEVAAIRKRYAAAVRWYDELLRDRPAADDGRDDRRYNAACAAARAGCGQGSDDPPPGAAEQTRLRQQALDWLRAELKVLSVALAAADPKVKEAVRATLRRWTTDPDLSGVRDTAGLAALPDDEHDDWRQLWADVATAITPARK